MSNAACLSLASNGCLAPSPGKEFAREPEGRAFGWFAIFARQSFRRHGNHLVDGDRAAGTRTGGCARRQELRRVKVQYLTILGVGKSTLSYTL